MGNKGGKMKVSKKKAENGAADANQDGEQKQETPEGENAAGDKKPEGTTDEKPAEGATTAEGESDNKVAQVTMNAITNFFWFYFIKCANTYKHLLNFTKFNLHEECFTMF